ncbi:hypothetical protein ACIBHY_20595 [Nonomuraea sp. NPDC050547]|uniref:hypothetical protein n=1 Tax=Nonomuraea sp. NPDC050547 TaxID=3364368 RepID=UPI0037A4BBB3
MEPVVDFDLSRCKFIDEVYAASGLDGRPNIVEMDPLKFEHLILPLSESAA